MNRLRRTIRHVADELSTLGLEEILATLLMVLVLSLPMILPSLRSNPTMNHTRSAASQQMNYVSTMSKADMSEALRGAAGTMAQEVAKAGVVPATSATLVRSVVGSPLSQSVTLDSTANMFAGETLQVDYTSAAYETVTIAAVSSGASLTAVFTKNHSGGVVVWAGGVFPQGILSSSTGNVLQLFGDINSDGTLVYEEYSCDTTAGTLSRSITPIGATSKNPAVILVQGVTPNPDGTACFTYSSATLSGYTFVTNISLTVTTRLSEIDPQTGANATITGSFQNLSPRSITAALSLAQAGMTAPLQPTPPGLPML